MSGSDKDKAASGHSRTAGDMEQVGVLTRIVDGKAFTLGFGSLRVGRQRRADLVITDKTVSRHHADVIYESGRYVLYDHSTNGTWVNGNLVAVAQPLRDRDTVKFGKVEFVFSTKSMPKDQALRSGETTVPTKVPGSSTVIMRGGKGIGRGARRLKRIGLGVALVVLVLVLIYFALPDVADRVISQLPASLQRLLGR
jgi:pSer/pThr/pTyr-binding forkhead associated (FHA) protein